jgi:hypothetical protein
VKTCGFHTRSGIRRLVGGEHEIRAVSVGSIERLPRLTGGVDGTWTISGRSALFIVLNNLKRRGVTRVHLPAFLCGSILAPVDALGLKTSFYPVDRALVGHPDPPPGSAVIVIHYFGWENPAARELRRDSAGRYHLIEDLTHVFPGAIRGPLPGVHLFFSARKHGAIPMGGWCSLRASPGRLDTTLNGAVAQSLAARALRGAYLSDPDAPVDTAVEGFYLQFLGDVEAAIEAHPSPARLHPLVSRLLAGVDWDDVARRRRNNWKTLERGLRGTVRRATPPAGPGSTPFGYVIRTGRRDAIRSALAKARIFCPIHWPLPAVVDRRRFPDAAHLSDSLLTLPVDQRYGRAEMHLIIESVRKCLG